jgi:hypothetical protein
MSNLNIIFDGPPAAQSGRFIEVEDDEGRSINAGEWIDRGDGTWVLRLATPETTATTIDEIAHLCNHGYAICSPCDHVPYSWKVQP